MRLVPTTGVFFVLAIGLAGFSAQAAGGTDSWTGKYQIRVSTDCTTFDDACLQKVKANLVKATDRTNFAGETAFFLAKVKEGYVLGAKSRRAKQASYDYYFDDPRPPEGRHQTRHCIHFSWGEIIGIGLGIAALV